MEITTIINNIKHKNAKLKKASKSLKPILISSISADLAVIISLIYSGLSSYTFDNNYVNTEYSYKDIISGEAEEREIKSLIESYEENIAEKENDTVNIFDSMTNIYDSTLPDSTIIDLNETTIRDIMWSVYGDPDYKNYVTIEDLKKVEDLSGIFEVNPSFKEGLGWLNYCENLKWLEFRFDSISDLEMLKQINGLNISGLQITGDNTFYKDAGFDINEEYFSFLKSCSNLNILIIDSCIVALTDPYLDSILQENNTEIVLYKFGANSQKVDFDAIKNCKKVIIEPLYNTGIYDIATVFTREQINQLINYGVEFEVKTNGWNSGQTTINQEELLNLLNPIYDQIDFLITLTKTCLKKKK